MQTESSIHKPQSSHRARKRNALTFPARSARIEKRPTPVTHALRGVSLSISKRYKKLHNAAYEADKELYQYELSTKGEVALKAYELGFLNDNDLAFINDNDLHNRAVELNNALNKTVETLNQGLVDKINTVSEVLVKEHGICDEIVSNAFSYLDGGVGFGSYDDKLVYSIDGWNEHIFYETSRLQQEQEVGRAFISDYSHRVDGSPLHTVLEYGVCLFDGLVFNDKDLAAYRSFMLIYEKASHAECSSSLGLPADSGVISIYKEFLEKVYHYAIKNNGRFTVEEALFMRCDTEDMTEVFDDPETIVDVAHIFGEVVGDSIGVYLAEQSHKCNSELVDAHIKENPTSPLSRLIKAITAHYKPVDYSPFGAELEMDGLPTSSIIHSPIGYHEVINLGLDEALERHHQNVMQAGEGSNSYPISLSQRVIEQVENRAVNLFLALVFAAYCDSLPESSVRNDV